MRKHNNDSNQYLVCRMCKLNKHISYYRFKRFRCRLCMFLHWYKINHNKDQFKKYEERYKINFQFNLTR